ncbi:LacI family DNA-binding transcriptional regulator [Zhihengliuella flava]|uniref:LacI family transcriptional regulator n=1 Tax=Zhihengliuella flava TaxID=1285193 RepID=A0A931D7I4_9MICC|nr:LacI family DNA-binding transcriptional regulator [Zhihengliuella flava]MBG6083842.1 LacI family transcriptional regulator [Zhihengliuella flava]
MPTRRPTAQDVAKRAGASRSAVSMVMNGTADGNVSADLQDRIRRAAAQLEYTPHPIASGLRRQRSQMIGIVTDEAASSPFAGRMLAGASQAAAAQGYLTVIADAGGPAADTSHFVEELRRRRVDGLILATQSLRTIHVADGLRRQPSVLANCRDAAGTMAAIIPDEERGGREATEHLLALGHRRIVWIGGGNDIDARPARIRGFQTALASAGLPPGEVVEAGWDIDDGFRAAEVLFSRETEVRPHALFCANDRVATGALLAARTAGLGVPGDVSIMGYDDQRHLADATVPGLTTMALPHEGIGRVAAERLIAALDGQAMIGTDTTLLECPLVVRGSTGPRP